MATAATKTAPKKAATPAAPAATEDTVAPLAVPKIQRVWIKVPIIGTAPLLVHRFSEKAKKQMLDAMQGVKNPKQPKDPNAEFEAAHYYLRGSTQDNPLYAFPAVGFKAATVSSARLFGGITMVQLRQTLFVRGDEGDDGQMMVRIMPLTRTSVGTWNEDADGRSEMREDVVRVNRGGTDLRYRPMFRTWGATLDVQYVASVLTRESVLSLIEAGGLSVGVGEWRPEKGGDFGTYEIDPNRNVEEITIGG